MADAGTRVAGFADRLRRARFRAGIRLRYQVRPRIAAVRWFADRLPWEAWVRLCASDAASVVREIGRRSSRPMRFLQIGANEGRINDPIHDTVRARGWSGVLVEPLPHLFDQLVANYRDVPGLEFANVAIGHEDGRIPMFVVQPRSDDPEWATQIASLDRDVVLRHAYALPDLDDRIVTVDVECLRLSTLIDRYGVSRLDLLLTDAEGFDYEILRQVPLAAAWAPTFVVFESKHLGIAHYRETVARFSREGYRVVSLWPDAFAYRAPPV